MNVQYIAEPLQHLAVDISALSFDPQNARKHDRSNLDAVKASLERFGQVEPLVVQKQGMIVRAGNGRLTVAKELGWTQIAAVVVDQTDTEAIAFAIADNRTSELGSWDYSVLVDLLSDNAVDVTDLGFSDGDLDSFRTEVFASSVDDIDLGIDASTTDGGVVTSTDIEKEKEIEKNIRRVMLYMEQEQYDRTLVLLLQAMEDLDVENHSEAIIAVLEKVYGEGVP